MTQSPLFSIFTATFNRAHTLHRVYESLRDQTLRDFEWLVIDDGSTDGTAEQIAAWQKLGNFPIRYFVQPHSGKHVAHNLAVREAHGYLLVVLDSDDGLVPNALERMAHHWNSIPHDERASFSGVRGLSRDQHGKLVGDKFPRDRLVSDQREQRYVHKLRGEKCAAWRTDICRAYPFPIIPGTQFIPEAVVWLDIAKRYRHVAVNEVFRIYFVDDPQTGATLTRRKSLGDNAAGRLHYYVWLLNNDIEYFVRSPMPFFKAAIMLPLVSRYAGQPIRQTWSELRNGLAKLLVVWGYPTSMLLYFGSRARDVVRQQGRPPESEAYLRGRPVHTGRQ
jgi:glycosyltransferase involved in cell wall biosynthesis